MRKLEAVFSSDCRNKGLQYWDYNNLRTYNNIQNIATGQVDDFTTGCLLDYPYFKEYCELIATDLSKQLKLDADPKAIQHVNFTGNLYKAEGAKMLFIFEYFYRLFIK